MRDPRTGERDRHPRRHGGRAVDRRSLPKPTREERTRALLAAIAEAQRNGITSVQNADGAAPSTSSCSTRRPQAATLDMRVYSALPVHSARTDDRTSPPWPAS